MQFDPELNLSTRKYIERLRASGVDVMEVPDASAAERVLAQLVECFRVPPGAETERAAPER